MDWYSSFQNKTTQNKNFNNIQDKNIGAFIDTINFSFTESPSYFQVTKIKAGVIDNTLYDTWIMDENSYKQDIGKKKIIMRPSLDLQRGEIVVIPKWNNQQWLVTKIDPQVLYYNTGYIEKFNNTMAWFDENDNLNKELCIIEYGITRDRLTFDTIPIAEGDIKVTVQHNSNTSKIKMNQRFIFDGQAFKIQRITSFLRNDPSDKDSVPILYFNMYKDNIASDDDLDNNIANINQYKYELKINQDSFQQSIGYTEQLTATVKLNNEIINKQLEWVSSNESLATVDNNGNLTLLNNGNVNITCRLLENNLINDNINIQITSAPAIVKTVVISPNNTTLYEEDDPTIYTVYTLENNNQTLDGFTITASGVPVDYYRLVVINANSFSIQCLKAYSSNNLTITCIDNQDNSLSNTINIKLKGAW